VLRYAWKNRSVAVLAKKSHSQNWNGFQFISRLSGSIPEAHFITGQIKTDAPLEEPSTECEWPFATFDFDYLANQGSHNIIAFDIIR